MISSVLEIPLGERVFKACLPESKEELREDKEDEDRAMAWKRHSPSALRTTFKSMYIGASISLLTGLVVGAVYMLVTYLPYKTVHNCPFMSTNSLSIQIQWMRTISDVISCAFLYHWYFSILLFLFRPFQLQGVKRKLILVCTISYFLDSLYRVALQAFGTSHSNISFLQNIPLNVLFLINQCLQVYFITNHFCTQSRRQKLTFSSQLIVPGFFSFFIFIIITLFIYPAYQKQNEEGKLLIALFAPLVGLVLKVFSRICVQRLYNITHPGYSHVLLSPIYLASAVMFRVLQAVLGNLKSIAILGIIHGATEVIERSTMVVIDHICHLPWKRTSAPWGSFRTPCRERLMADIAIMSMLSESTAIVAVNRYLYFYQFIYLQNKLFINLLQSFVQLFSAHFCKIYFS